MKMNVKNKFLLPTLATIVICMLIVTYLAYSQSKSALMDSVKDHTVTISTNLAQKIDDWLLLITDNLKVDSNIAEMKAVYTTDPDSPEYDTVVRKANAFLKDGTDRHHMIHTALLDTNGIVLASSSGKTGSNYADREFFMQAMAGNDFITNGLVSKTTGKPAISMAIPVTLQGRIVGVMFTTTGLVEMTENFIDDVKIGEHGYAYLFQPDGLVIGNPDKKRILSDNLNNFEFGRNLIAKKTGFHTYEYKGSGKLVSLSQMPTTGWIVAVGANQADMFSSVSELGNFLMLSTFITLLLVGLVVWYIAHKLTKPLIKAKEVITFFAQGILDKRISINQQDEIGELSRSIDDLMDDMQGFCGLLNSIGDGDLTQDVPSKSENDQLSEATQKMLDGMRNMVSTATEASLQVAAGTNQVSGSSQSLSQGATEQASSLEEITSSMTQISSQTKTNAENAAQANKMMDEAGQVVNEGLKAGQLMAEAMIEISADSEKIVKIIKVIDEIAFQTNLLALNAAVEAARAGKHGKGFAVVAEEVRNLAGRSAKAAQETADLIESSVAKINHGEELSDQLDDHFKHIVTSSEKVNEIINEIAAASNEQAEGVSQVNQGLSQIEQVTQQNTANAEETASAAEELSAQAMELKQTMSQFKLPESAGTTVIVQKPQALPQVDSDSDWGCVKF